MDAVVISFLVLLGGTPAEHVIQMSSMNDCLRASEYVAQAQCLDQEEYDHHVEATGGGIATASGALVAPPNALRNLPSAAQRRLRNVLNPVPATPTIPIRRLSARKAAPS